MNICNYQYINITEITGNIEVDVNNFLLQNNKKKTLEHVIDVANTNKEIALQYNLDEKICTISGYLHDISAVIHPNDMLNYMIENNLFVDESERKYPYILHQRISKIIAKKSIIFFRKSMSFIYKLYYR